MLTVGFANLRLVIPYRITPRFVKPEHANGGKALAADGSYLPANVSRESWVDVEIEVEQSMQSYLDVLDEELAKQPGFKKPPVKVMKKRNTTSTTHPDCGYIHHGTKRGVGYLMETTENMYGHSLDNSKKWNMAKFNRRMDKAV